MMRAPNTPIRIAFISLTLALGVACQSADESSVSDEEMVGTSAQNLVEINGSGLNGSGLNGSGLNGSGLNGSGLNGSGLNGSGLNGSGLNAAAWGSPGSPSQKTATLVGFAFDTTQIFGFVGNDPVKAMWTDGSEIKLTLKNGGIVSGANLVGAFVVGKLNNGIPLILRINAHETFTSIEGATLNRYVVEFKTFWAGGFACGKDNNLPTKAIPLSGTWNYGSGVPGGGSKTSNPNLITFACAGYALYKCVDFGYHPWATLNGESLEDHHQTCTRMIRADYCGDGKSHTVNGTMVNLYDDLGLQTDTETWPIEAEWDPNGARCLSHWRIQSMGEALPCQFERTAAECGNPVDWEHTLIATEAQ